MCIEYLFLLSYKHNYVDIVHYFYSVLQYVSAVHFSHHLVGHMFTKWVQGRAVSLHTVGVKLLWNYYSNYYSKNGIVNDVEINM
jgi:hypothetical protein